MLAVVAPLLVACVVEGDERRGDGTDPDGSGATTASAAANGSATGSASSSASDSSTKGTGAPTGSGVDGGSGPDGITAVVDTNRSLTAVAGRGVGVFVEYDSGGHWTVTWTCDTALSNMTCDFDLAFTIVGGGVPTNVQPYGAPTLLPVENGLVVTSTVGESLDALTFDTPAGATLEMTTKLSGELNGAIVFFVQDGVVNGGYPGALSDPLDFVGAGP